MNEKVKFLNGEVYDIVPGGFMVSEEMLKIVLLPGEKTLSDIDVLTDNEANTSRIELLDGTGDMIDIRKGYVYQCGCEKKKDYVVGREEYENGEDSEGNPITAYRDIRGVAVVVTMKKSDIRTEVNDIKETVDMLVIASLGV